MAHTIRFVRPGRNKAADVFELKDGDGRVVMLRRREIPAMIRGLKQHRERFLRVHIWLMMIRRHRLEDSTMDEYWGWPGGAFRG
ncbi:MAG: hypothetical protein KAT75_07235 [Dehalococcoidia bacterium]|nr:hypothetical protein [Dehalococcoidia bacterium]